MSAPAIESYYQISEFGATIRGQRTRIVSKPGFANWDRLSPAQALLADSIALRSTMRVLHLCCGHGALGVALARGVPDGQVLLQDAHYAAVQMAERTLAANQIANGRVTGGPALTDADREAFDVVVLEAPPGRKLARRWLAHANAALRPGGQIYVAGPKAEGIESLVGDVRALFGQAATLGYRDHNRVAIGAKITGTAPPTWANEPGIAPGTWHHFALTMGETTYEIDSLPGIFAFDKLDAGTALLLENLRVRASDRVLDVGCGYGIIGMVAARAGAARVDLIDVHLPAVEAAQQNLARAELQQARVLASDAYSALTGERYDLVITNPPFHAGKAVDYGAAEAILSGARSVLTPSGALLLVANAFIRYERLLGDLFSSVEQIAGNRQFQVLRAIPQRGAD